MSEFKYNYRIYYLNFHFFYTDRLYIFIII